MPVIRVSPFVNSKKYPNRIPTDALNIGIAIANTNEEYTDLL